MKALTLILPKSTPVLRTYTRKEERYAIPNKRWAKAWTEQVHALKNNSTHSSLAELNADDFYYYITLAERT